MPGERSSTDGFREGRRGVGDDEVTSARTTRRRRLVPTEVEASVRIARCCSPPPAAARLVSLSPAGARVVGPSEGGGGGGESEGFSRDFVSSLPFFSFLPLLWKRWKRLDRWWCGPARGLRVSSPEGSRQRPRPFFFFSFS